nr:hypothetical protein Iba_scaffold2661CG0040 [Ipomoea batatas]
MKSLEPGGWTRMRGPGTQVSGSSARPPWSASSGNHLSTLEARLRARMQRPETWAPDL